MKNLLKIASAVMKERELTFKVRKLQEQAAKLREVLRGGYGHYSLSTADDRQDLVISITLAEYLGQYPEAKPALNQYSQNETIDGIEHTGQRQYFKYPAQFVGTLPGNTPTHVWVESSTATVWAKDDPKPKLESSTATEIAA